MEEPKKIEFIYLAKGICILLVVFGHVQFFVHGGREFAPYQEPIRLFFMSLFFFLSGLFFRRFNSFSVFLKKRINNLLVPFVFYFLTTSYLLPIILNLIMPGYYETSTLDFLKLAYFTDFFPNNPLWFLLCLFEMNIIFYFISFVSSKFKHSLAITIGLSAICGVIRVMWLNII